jgi:DNA-binding response OmpR family regulator
LERILIVDDDFDLAQALSDLVTADGRSAEIAHGGEEAIQRATHDKFDLIVLDMNLGDLDGFAVCERLRASGVPVPILVLSGQTETSHKVKALKVGADDYVSKPFVVDELLARIGALLRRSRGAASTITECRVGPAHVDFQKAVVTRSGQTLSLSAKEVQLLRYLVEHRNCVLSREHLLKYVWGYVSTDTRTVDVHVATIRQKLEDDPQRPRFIATVRGKGYMFCD